jgi:AcrR family transcriptional regulator
MTIPTPARRSKRAAPPPAKPTARSGASGRSAKSRAGAGDRRGAILAIAARYFAAHGFESSTIRQIADEADILGGSIYHHFDTKEEILDEVIRDTVHRTRDASVRIATAKANPEDRLAAMIVLNLHEVTRNREVTAILYNDRKTLARKENFSYVLEAQRDRYAAWRRVLEDGAASGAFKPDLDVFLTVSTLTKMLATCLDWFRLDGDYTAEAVTIDPRELAKYGIDQLIDFHLDMMFRAVRADARIAEPIPRAAGERLLAAQS